MIRNLAIFFVVVFWLATSTGSTRTRGGGSRIRGSSRWRPCSALVPPSSGRSSTCSSGRRSTSRTCASASSRSGRWRSGSAARPALPGLPRRGRARVPRLPGLHDEAEAGVRHLQGAARGALAGLPVLRDADRPTHGRVRRDDRAAADERSTPRLARRATPARRGTAESLTATSRLARVARRAHPGPDQAGRRRARPRRRDPRALRARAG